MSDKEVLVYQDRDALVANAASLISSKISKLTHEQEQVNIVLTGGTVGIQILKKLSELTSGHDLSKLHIWWVDERFVPKNDPERNDLQARNAWINSSTVQAENIHSFPAADGGSLDDGAKDFAAEIEESNPQFDLVLLGMGEDGHVASLFPGRVGKQVGDWVVAEANSPKPPSYRLSLSFWAINQGKEVLFMVSGIEKAEAVRQVFAGIGNLPAESISGTLKTTWLLDEAASSLITSS